VYLFYSIKKHGMSVERSSCAALLEKRWSLLYYYFLLLGGKPPRDQDLVCEPLIKTSKKVVLFDGFCGWSGAANCVWSRLFINYRFRANRSVKITYGRVTSPQPRPQAIASLAGEREERVKCWDGGPVGSIYGVRMWRHEFAPKVSVQMGKALSWDLPFRDYPSIPFLANRAGRGLE